MGKLKIVSHIWYCYLWLETNMLVYWKKLIHVFLFWVKYAVMSLQKLHYQSVSTLGIFKGNLFTSLRVAMALRKLKSENGWTGLIPETSRPLVFALCLVLSRYEGRSPLHRARHWLGSYCGGWTRAGVGNSRAGSPLCYWVEWCMILSGWCFENVKQCRVLNSVINVTYANWLGAVAFWAQKVSLPSRNWDSCSNFLENKLLVVYGGVIFRLFSAFTVGDLL